MLAYNKARYVEDAVAIVAVETESQAETALSVIDIEYDLLPVVTNPKAGLTPGDESVYVQGNVLMHIQFSKGNIQGGFAQSDLILGWQGLVRKRVG